ncbi:hypothetical protein CCMA1212_003998 [Trichoderma ghanense]|uniref:DUF6604 domain-containing protein n=1 Tax=Trichoderma ghanense TaxID=65468 RepID=A0ABY2H7D1_9HYPO
MKFDSCYVSYKKETGRLLYWMIQTSNSIIEALDPSKDDCSLKVNLTGQAPVSDLVPMAKLIATHRGDVPSKMLALFHSVIELRTIYCSQFQELASISPSQELLENNSRHKYFIDVLTEVFHVLGGEAWLAEQDEKAAEGDEEVADAEVSATANRFSALNLENESESDTSQGEDNGEADEDASSFATPRQQRKRQNGNRKGKGKGKGKKSKGKKPGRADDQHLGDVPLESYHITEDNELQHYFMAVFSLAKDWMELRSLLQDLWRKVAYRDLNSAMVAALGNIAVAMIKQTEAVIFGDFPGYESLDMMILTFTHGDPEKAASECRFLKDLDDVKGFWEREKMPVDIQEAFLINAYDDLVDFINDFQKTRSGKPTKRMLAQLRGWDPYFDLQTATKKERLKWRRSYTINWLYDLVNAVAGGALHGPSEDGKPYVLEDVDWGAEGPFRLDRRLFGLLDFAVEVTTLAMQKPGTAFRNKITPHLVFHLQCIMDAWTVSRGWAISGIHGHVLGQPASNCVPRRHLDMFLGQGEWKTKGFGFSRGVAALRSLWGSFRHTGQAYEDITTCIGLYEEVSKQFDEALGVSQVARIPAVVPSRFSTTNRNGLWDYSPFLCGAGLAEALELSYRCAMRLWEDFREFLLVVYLHGSMVAQEYLDPPLPLYRQLDTMFRDSFFSAGRPNYDFYKGPERKTHDFRRQERPSRRATSSPRTVDDLLDMFPLQHYKHKSELVLYKRAGWDPDRIPDSDVHHMSALGLIRLSQMSRLYNPATSDWMIAGANLLRSQLPKVAKKESDVVDDAVLKSVRQRVDAMDKNIKEMTILPNGIIAPLSWIIDPSKVVNKDPRMTPEMMLDVIWNDLYSDICCEIKPYSSLNYLWITVNVLKFYDNFEEEARTNGSAAIKAMFDETIEDLSEGRDKRIFVSLFAMTGTDKELMKTVARTSRKNDPGVSHLRYFDEERPEDEERGPVLRREETPCCVM